MLIAVQCNLRYFGCGATNMLLSVSDKASSDLVLGLSIPLTITAFIVAAIFVCTRRRRYYRSGTSTYPDNK